jgi:hypothetical protein
MRKYLPLQDRYGADIFCSVRPLREASQCPRA